jgi:hypothetical protein
MLIHCVCVRARSLSLFVRMCYNAYIMRDAKNINTLNLEESCHRQVHQGVRLREMVALDQHSIHCIPRA